MAAGLVRSGRNGQGERNHMAAEVDADKELIVHRRGYESFIRLLRVAAVICLVIAFIIILIIS
jgi:hypothetical protein